MGVTNACSPANAEGHCRLQPRIAGRGPLVLNKFRNAVRSGGDARAILKLAAELGYQPNHPARMFRAPGPWAICLR